MKAVKYQIELSKLYSELEQVKSMSELEACEFCNADSKLDVLEAIQEEIDYCESMISECEESEGMSECSGYHLDAAFSSWEQVNAMFV